MQIQQAAEGNLAEILAIYAAARRFMADNGNPTQWYGGYPPEWMVRQDIAQGACHLCVDHGQIVGVFAYFEGPDPAYAVIDGAWPGSAPYGVIHRLAAAPAAHGVAGASIAWCAARGRELRVDTHDDNGIMQRLLEQNGFVRCGYIKGHDDVRRIAYWRAAQKTGRA